MAAAAPTGLSQLKLFSPRPTKGGYFGDDVAVDGDTLVIGEPGLGSRRNTGAAWVYVRTDGAWALQAKLSDPALEYSSDFGAGVAVSGDTIVVGAPGQPRTGGPRGHYGMAYVFVRSGSTWIKQAELSTLDGIGNLEYGDAVDLEGDTIVVGARLLNIPPNRGSDSGAVYVYGRSGATWSLQQRLVSDDGQHDYFGGDISLDGDTMAIGAVRDSSPTTKKAGAVYVFTRTGAAWARQAKLFAADQEEFVDFGSRVDVDGDTMVVGTGQVGERAYVFGRTGAAWSQQARLVATGDGGSENFGMDVAVDANTVLVGETQAVDSARQFLGSTHVFAKSGSQWVERAEIFPAAGEDLDEFGHAIDFDGVRAVVGAPLAATPNGEPHGGAVYVFQR